jgi:hypothetical protein
MTVRTRAPATSLMLPAVLAPLLGACSEYEYVEQRFEDVYRQGGEERFSDVVFVVDDSASMAEEQAQLAASFAGFVDVLSTTYADFRLGVTTTDPDAPAMTGAPLSPDTPDIEDAFIERVAVGTDGSREEQGWLRAFEAMDPATNPGFRRPGASLVVVFFSDEDDHSGGAVQGYVDGMAQLAGEAGLRVHAIVGDEPGGCVSGISAADPGSRYLEGAALTDGLIGSICEEDYSELLREVAFDVAGWADLFPLSRIPELATLEVRVDGVLIPNREVDGWTYALGDNAVWFHDRAVPRPGQDVVMTYQAVEGAQQGDRIEGAEE